MNIVPEVYFAWEIKPCYAALKLVSNYWKGLVSADWTNPGAFREFRRRWSRPAAEAVLHTLRSLDTENESYGCTRYRWSTIIQ